ncbi:hypothetical protein EJ04DRAFT_77729, partial [Polyplosphaeria fusca]
DNTVKVWDARSSECLQTLHIGKALHSISFDVTNSYLHTDIGVIDVSVLSSPKPSSVIAQPQHPQYYGPTLSIDGMWIKYGPKKLLWLPSEYRPSCSVVSGEAIAAGVGNGRVWICEVLQK